VKPGTVFLAISSRNPCTFAGARHRLPGASAAR
jgi:hypothetical protein